MTPRNTNLTVDAGRKSMWSQTPLIMKMRRALLRKTSSPAFQILSDLHLEVGQQYASFDIPRAAPYLILAGDIGRLIDYDSYLAFLAKQTAHFELVFLVLGNHEFYGLCMAAGLEQARKLESEALLGGKLKLLHQERFDIPNSDVTILGCTLWSKIPDEAKDTVKMRVKDFSKIENWTTDNHNTVHDSDLSWLHSQTIQIQQENQSKVDRDPKRKILVVTHHAPSLQETSSPKNVANPWSSAFASDVLQSGDWEDVKVWIFGHTHFTTEFERGGIRVVSNQRGYVLPGSKGGGGDEGGKFDVRRVVRV